MESKTTNKVKISILIPVYNEARNIPPLYNAIINSIKAIKTYEILFINDGSTDFTKKAIEDLIAKDNNVKLINFRRNFGKADALSIGFERAKGDIVITMDGDMQDDPAEIPRFLQKIDEGYDLVSGWKIKRRDPISKTLPSKLFNRLTASVSGLNIHDFNCGFKAYKRDVIKNINIYGELHRYIPALAHWEGYGVGEIAVKHHRRLYGKSKYGIARLLKGFLDLLTIKYLHVYKKRPLHLFGSVGLVCMGFGVIIGAYLFDQWVKGLGIGQRPLLTLSILLMILGIQFITTGFLAEMITSNQKNDINNKIKDEQ